MNSAFHFLQFSWQDRSFFFQSEEVQRLVAKPPRLSPLPYSHPYILGASLERGEIIPWIQWPKFWNLSPLLPPYHFVAYVQLNSQNWALPLPTAPEWQSQEPSSSIPLLEELRLHLSKVGK